MTLEECASYLCPYCWQKVDTIIDCSIDHQQYIEDCSVCCRPVLFRVTIDPDKIPLVEVFREDDA